MLPPDGLTSVYRTSDDIKGKVTQSVECPEESGVEKRLGMMDHQWAREGAGSSRTVGGTQ